MDKFYDNRDVCPAERRARRLSLAAGVVVLVSLGLSFCLYIPALAYLTDAQRVSADAQAGTVRISAPDFSFATADSPAGEPVASGNRLTVWNPGDIVAVRWEVSNLGNKSVNLRYTARIYWDEGPGMTAADDETPGSPLWAESPYLLLYPASMADADIMNDLQSGQPGLFIDIGNSNAECSNASGSTRYGYEYAFVGATLDGVGENAETGDADRAGATSDEVEFKLALSPRTPAGYMGKTLAFDITVEAKQHRNTAVFF